MTFPLRSITAVLCTAVILLSSGLSLPTEAAGKLTSGDTDTIAELNEAAQAVARANAETREKERVRKHLKSQTLTVSSDGTGDYRTIQSAIWAAHNGDVILISPGVYHEQINNRYKSITIMGSTGDPEDVIIEGSDSNYFRAPLEMSRGVLRDLTVMAVDSGEESDCGLPAYALHCDFEAEENDTFLAENCRFVSSSNTTVGMGTKLNCSITFRECIFENMAGGPALFLHDLETGETAYEQDGVQSVRFENCNFLSHGLEDDSPVVILQSEELHEGAAMVTFIDNTVTADHGGDLFAMRLYNPTSSRKRMKKGNYMGSSDWILDPDSSGNSIPEMNAEISRTTSVAQK